MQYLNKSLMNNMSTLIMFFSYLEIIHLPVHSKNQLIISSMHRSIGHQALSIVTDNTINDSLIEIEKLKEENLRYRTFQIIGSHRNEINGVGDCACGSLDSVTLPGRILWTIPMSNPQPMPLGRLPMLDFTLAGCTIESSRGQQIKAIWIPNDNKEGIVCFSFGSEFRMIIVTGKFKGGPADHSRNMRVSIWDWFNLYVKYQYRKATSYENAMTKVGSEIFRTMNTEDFEGSTFEIVSVSVRPRNVRDMLESIDMNTESRKSMRSAVRKDVSLFDLQYRM